ncbi:MAG: aminotransferase class I/II-fold pyridoxal phosphate-dependent enzyme, partial [Nitrospinota bacterium]
QVFVGNAGDDVLSVLARTFLNEGEEVIVPAPTFSPYAHVSRIMGARVVTSPLREFRIDLEDIRARLTGRTKLIFLCSPNNPTGGIVPERELAPFLEALPPRALVLLDEAYGDFVDDPEFPDAVALAGRFPLIVLRSFSKIYGLAGLRIGYGVGSGELIGYMDRVREPFNVNLLAQAAAAAALDDEGFRRRAIEAVREGRRSLYAAFKRLELAYVESQANFVFVRVGDGDAVFEALMRRGVIVRPGSVFGCPEWIRVTVGLPGEEERFLQELRRVLA